MIVLYIIAYTHCQSFAEFVERYSLLVSGGCLQHGRAGAEVAVHTHTLSLSLSHTHTHIHTLSLSLTHTHTHTDSKLYSPLQEVMAGLLAALTEEDISDDSYALGTSKVFLT